jgi:hypothetical protein
MKPLQIERGIPVFGRIPMERQPARVMADLTSRLAPSIEANRALTEASVLALRGNLKAAKGREERQAAGLDLIRAEREMMTTGLWHGEDFWKEVSKQGKIARKEARKIDSQKYMGARGLEAYHFSPRAFVTGLSALIEAFSPIHTTEVRAGTIPVLRNGERKLEAVFKPQTKIKDGLWFVEMASLGFFSLMVVSLAAFAPVVAVGLGVTAVIAGGKLISDSFYDRDEKRKHENVYDSKKIKQPFLGTRKSLVLQNAY